MLAMTASSSHYVLQGLSIHPIYHCLVCLQPKVEKRSLIVIITLVPKEYQPLTVLPQTSVHPAIPLCSSSSTVTFPINLHLSCGPFDVFNRKRDCQISFLPFYLS